MQFPLKVLKMSVLHNLNIVHDKIGEIFSSSKATLYMKSSDQTVSTTTTTYF